MGKKAEIQKLDEKGKSKEMALKRSQAMLDEDVARFDTFLQANDSKAHRALKSAEELSKLKAEKLSKMKTVRGRIAQVQSEIAKYKDQKEECTRFKSFLDQLTPSEWKSRQGELKRQAAARKKQVWFDVKNGEIEEKI